VILVHNGLLLLSFCFPLFAFFSHAASLQGQQLSSDTKCGELLLWPHCERTIWLASNPSWSGWISLS